MKTVSLRTVNTFTSSKCVCAMHGARGLTPDPNNARRYYHHQGSQSDLWLVYLVCPPE